MAQDELDRLLADLAEHDGLPVPSREEVTAVLDLARVVAHGSVRRGAPVAAYAAGLAIGAGTDPRERLARVRELLADVEERMAGDG